MFWITAALFTVQPIIRLQDTTNSREGNCRQEYKVEVEKYKVKFAVWGIGAVLKG